MSRTSVQELLKAIELYDIGPKKSLSQNFLIDSNVAHKITSLIGNNDAFPIIEIGPGFGALTEVLLQKGKDLCVIEKDDRLIPLLKEMDGNLQVLHTDALEVDYAHIFPDSEKMHVLSNLPYSISTPILEILLPLYSHIQSVLLVVQKEFAAKLLAKVGDPEYGFLALFAQYYSEVKPHFTLSRHVFFPKPKIESMVVEFQLRKPPYREECLAMIRSGFRQKRKTIMSNLKLDFNSERIQMALSAIGKSNNARAHELTIGEWNALACFYFSNSR